MEMPLEAAKASAERNKLILVPMKRDEVRTVWRPDWQFLFLAEGVDADRVYLVFDRRDRFTGELIFDGDGRVVSYFTDFGLSRAPTKQVVDNALVDDLTRRLGEPVDGDADPYRPFWPDTWERAYRGSPYSVRTWSNKTCDTHLTLTEGRVPGYNQIFTMLQLQRIGFLRERSGAG
jgi:hypothetical protein